MTNIADFPYFEIEIDKLGDLVSPVSVARQDSTTDLFVIAHGWNCNMLDARGLYQNFFALFSRTLKTHGAPGIDVRQCAVAGILWPAEKFTDPTLIPGGAAALGVKAGVEMLLNQTTYSVMKDRAGMVGRKAVATTLDRVQNSLPHVRIHLVGHSFGCRVITAAAAVSSRSVASMALFQAAFSHNSFSPDFDSSHQPGAFRNVVTNRKCDGPMVITHSLRDEALALAYPIASRILGQNASAMGDANSRYGALGRNGARHTPEASDGALLEEGAPYALAPGRIFNLRADNIILSHGDIVKPQTAWALLSASGLGLRSGPAGHRSA